jgi:hypothetical protein
MNIIAYRARHNEPVVPPEPTAQMKAVNGCRNLDRDAQREVKTHFTLTQVGRFC